MCPEPFDKTVAGNPPDLPVGWRSGLAALAAAAGAGIGPPLGPVVAASVTPGLLVAAQHMLAEWQGLRIGRAASVLEAAAADADVEISELIEATGEREPFQMLAGEAMQAGAGTLLHAKVRALARAVATGYQDDTTVDVQRLVVAALADMEILHVRVLHHMAIHMKEVARDGEEDLVMHDLGSIASSLPGISEDVAHAVIGTFDRHGLVFERPVDYGHIFAQFNVKRAEELVDTTGWLEIPPPGWFLSDLGLAVHEHLAAVADSR